MPFNNTLKRPGNFVARYGGEEFVVLLPETHPSGAVKIAEEIRINVALLNIPHAYNETFNYVTSSYGTASTVL